MKCGVVELVQRKFPNINYNFSTVGVASSSYVMVSATVNGRQYFGHARNKHSAQKDVAEQILDANKPLSQPTFKPWSSQWAKDATIPSNILEGLILKCFREVTSGHPEASDYKVLAGFVMTWCLDFHNGKVVALATGTKCISGDNLDCNGRVINDSHAEIVARRCLMKFLYTQLYWHSNPRLAAKSIFVKNEFGGYILRPEVHFHLYISTAPCGDGRVFSKCYTNGINNNFYGQLRSKVEGDAGTHIVRNRNFSQSWDDIINGVPLLTMSCSDKIARWNVLGVQGALLTSLIKPIYLYSIVLGDRFNYMHLHRAVCGRLENITPFLPWPYRLNFPHLDETTSSKICSNLSQRVPRIGINWTTGDTEPEIISLPTGRVIDNSQSSLCKMRFFFKYMCLLNLLPNIGNYPLPDNYAHAKFLYAGDYNMTKEILYESLQRAGLGCWIQKPIQQNSFRCSVGNP